MTKESMPADCPYNYGKCGERVVCELAGDDVSEEFHKVCLKKRKVWKDVMEYKGGVGLAFARSMVKEMLATIKRRKNE